jgi:hypothetical protein
MLTIPVYFIYKENYYIQFLISNGYKISPAGIANQKRANELKEQIKMFDDGELEELEVKSGFGTYLLTIFLLFHYGFNAIIFSWLKFGLWLMVLLVPILLWNYAIVFRFRKKLSSSISLIENEIAGKTTRETEETSNSSDQ